MTIFRRLRAAAIIAVTALFLMAIIDMFIGADWAGGLMSPLVVLTVFVIAYLAVPLVSKYISDK
jgi:hypothetical protein